MREVIFIGDAVTAAGYRLAGVDTRVPAAPEELAETVEAARADCRVLITTAATFAALPPLLAQALERGETPLLALVPDVRGRMGVADMEAEVRRALGIEV